MPMRTLVLIDARYASKVVHRIGKDKQTLDYANLLSVLTNQYGCNIISAQYFAPQDSAVAKHGATEETLRIRAKKDAYHRNLAAAPPNGPGLVVREFESRNENCRCPLCAKDFQVQVQNGIDVMLATQALRWRRFFQVFLFL